MGLRAKRRAASAFLAPATCHTIATARFHGEHWANGSCARSANRASAHPRVRVALRATPEALRQSARRTPRFPPPRQEAASGVTPKRDPRSVAKPPTPAEHTILKRYREIPRPGQA